MSIVPEPEPFVIRPCHEGDAETLVAMIRELAVFEKLEEFARATPESLRRHLFGPGPVAQAIVAEIGVETVAFALYFSTFSTFRGEAGLYLEDLYVKPAYRGQGIGKALITRLARLAVDRGCGRLEWSVLDWNEPAIGFYRSLGAAPMDDWTVFRLHENALADLAAKEPR